jgi:hypothetical protein
MISLMVLLSVSTTACSKYLYVRPECPDPARPVLEITDDQSVLKALNQAVGYSLAQSSQIECFKKSLK